MKTAHETLAEFIQQMKDYELYWGELTQKSLDEGTFFEIDEDERVVLKPKGAEELLRETYKYVSEGKQNAIKKAQIVILKDRLEAMAKEANDATNKYAFLAAGI